MLKVGIIGCGFMGTMHANCYKNIEGVKIVALADVRRECAEKLAEGTEAVIFGDGRELIDNAEVDIIDICLPTYLHCEYALMAMDKVKYLFVEKPVALTREEGEMMIAKSEATGCNLQVGQVIRFWDEYVVLKEMIDSGCFGRVVNANFRRISPIPTWGWNNWLLDTKYSGGAAQDLHIHDMDYVLSVFGRPEKICTVKNIIGGENSYINSLLSYKDFVVGVEGTWDLPESYPFDASFRVVFEKATVQNAGGKLTVFRPEGSEEVKIEKANLGAGFEGGNISDLGGYYNEILYFTTCAKRGEKITKATVKDGAASLNFVLDEIAGA